MNEPRIEAKASLSELAAYFRRVGDLWEGPDGCGTPGTDMCESIAAEVRPKGAQELHVPAMWPSELASLLNAAMAEGMEAAAKMLRCSEGAALVRSEAAKLLEG